MNTSNPAAQSPTHVVKMKSRSVGFSEIPLHRPVSEYEHACNYMQATAKGETVGPRPKRRVLALVLSDIRGDGIQAKIDAKCGRI